MKIELLWFETALITKPQMRCSSRHSPKYGVDSPVIRIEVPDEATGKAITFPGSPTSRINGTDIEPGWETCDDCTPRCRLYMTSKGLRGVPEQGWIESDSAAEMREYLDSQPERDLRVVVSERDTAESAESTGVE